MNTIPIPTTPFYAAMRRGHQTGHGHALRGHLAPHPTTTGVMVIVRTCCKGGQS
jgi:hypothetical protein